MLTRNFYILSCCQGFNDNQRFSPNTIESVGGNTNVKNTNTTAKSLNGGYYSFVPSNISNYSPAIGRFTTASTLSYTNSGVIVGSGTTPPTIDDRDLENRIKDGSLSGSCVVTHGVSDGKMWIRSIITISNSSESEKTINEVGIYLPTGTNNVYYLLERTVLDTPLVIAGNGIGKLYYKIELGFDGIHTS